MANRSTIFILRLVGIRSFQTALAGSTRMNISESMLNKQANRRSISLLILQLKVVISGFQAASRGEQRKIVRKGVIV